MPADVLANKERFISIYNEKITRRGADKLLEWLDSEGSDFFTAPASTRYHGAYEGGLCEHSLHVYDCLCSYLERERVKEQYGLEYTEESIAIASLLHDLCKINLYRVSYRNAKNEQGVWEKSALLRVPRYAALRPRREERVHSERVYAADARRSYGDTLAHGLFGRREHEHDRQSAGTLPAGAGDAHRGYGVYFFILRERNKAEHIWICLFIVRGELLG